MAERLPLNVRSDARKLTAINHRSAPTNSGRYSKRRLSSVQFRKWRSGKRRQEQRDRNAQTGFRFLSCPTSTDEDEGHPRGDPDEIRLRPKTRPAISAARLIVGVTKVIRTEFGTSQTNVSRGLCLRRPNTAPPSSPVIAGTKRRVQKGDRRHSAIHFGKSPKRQFARSAIPTKKGDMHKTEFACTSPLQA